MMQRARERPRGRIWLMCNWGDKYRLLHHLCQSCLIFGRRFDLLPRLLCKGRGNESARRYGW
jgi:hypothetical protein